MLSAVAIGIEHDSKMLGGISKNAKLLRSEQIKIYGEAGDGDGDGDGDDDDGDGDNDTDLVSDNSTSDDDDANDATPAPAPPAPCVPQPADGVFCIDDQTQTNIQPTPEPQWTGLVEDGYCDNFQEGSSNRLLGEGKSRFTPASLPDNVNQYTAGDCWQACDQDNACYQAHWIQNSSGKHCYIGVQSSETANNASCPGADASCTQHCYAKKGFGHNMTGSVEPGWCKTWRQGWKAWEEDVETNLGDQMKQCAGNPAREECSHWGAEFDLSPEGCWAKCKYNADGTDNAHCKEAVYEDKDQSWGCFIGLFDVNYSTSDPMVSRCADCNDHCYARDGFIVH